MRPPFTPREVIFAPTNRCNLSCGHCRVTRGRALTPETKLTAEDAVAFLRGCADIGVDRVGFSGGEPFLEIAFLARVIEEASSLGLYFDRLMTNGVWWKDGEELDAGLRAVLDAGFDGTLAISVDDWHGQDPSRVARLIRRAGELAGRLDWFEIATAGAKDGSFPLARLEGLAAALGAKLTHSGALPMAIRDAAARSGDEDAVGSGQCVDIPVIPIPFSPSGKDIGSWNASRWFSDDWCEGPGNVLYAHPDGMVAVCCGFANERPELIAGHVSEGAAALLAKARAMPLVKAAYERGLASIRDELERGGAPFPGKTNDTCQFCDWLCESRSLP